MFFQFIKADCSNGFSIAVSFSKHCLDSASIAYINKSVDKMPIKGKSVEKEIEIAEERRLGE